MNIVLRSRKRKQADGGEEKAKETKRKNANNKKESKDKNTNDNTNDNDDANRLDIARMSKRQCQERLSVMNKDLMCPICQTSSFCPFMFPCRKHYGCHACILQLLSNNCHVHYDAANDHFHVYSTLRCLYCSDSTSAQHYNVVHSASNLDPAPHIVLNALYGDSKLYKCPYCDEMNTMTALCKHIQSQCAEVKLPCVYCKDTYSFTTAGCVRHMKDSCAQIPCPYAGCRFRGTYKQLVEHCLPHRKLSTLRSTVRYISDIVLGNPRFLMPKLPTAADTASLSAIDVDYIPNTNPNANSNPNNNALALTESKNAPKAEQRQPQMTPQNVSKFNGIIDEWKQSTLDLTTKLIMVAAETNNVPPLVLLQRCGARRLCDSFNQDTNKLLMFDVESLEESDNEDE